MCSLPLYLNPESSSLYLNLNLVPDLNAVPRMPIINMPGFKKKRGFGIKRGELIQDLTLEK
jgi:hypothetical protein